MLKWLVPRSHDLGAPYEAASAVGLRGHPPLEGVGSSQVLDARFLR